MATSSGHTPEEENVGSKLDLLKDFPDKQDTPPKKILFLGDGGIGKTTLIQRYCEHVGTHYRCSRYRCDSSTDDNRMVEELLYTEFLLYHHIEGKRTLMRLLDLPSGTIEESRKCKYPDEIDSIVLCFAVHSLGSFANVWKIWLEESRRKYPDFARYYLLGLRNDKRENANVTPVTIENANQIHQKHKFLGQYMECSVEKNPKQAFDLMVTLISDTIRSEPSRAAV